MIKNFYIYRSTVNGNMYIGQRSTYNQVELDTKYFGSGKIV